MRQKIIVKIGSSSLTSPEGGLNNQRIHYFADELVKLQQAGYQVLLVTSGAVAAGFKEIGYKTRPSIIHEKQASAAVGQALLMQAYNSAFAQHNQSIAQILLTRSDFSVRKRINNALMTIEELLSRQVIPIVNENDTVSVDELKFGDNDNLSALVANLVKAQKLIIITDTDGLYTEDPRINMNAKRIDRIDLINEDILRIAGGSGNSVGTGGMRSKIEAARIAMRGGIQVFVGHAVSPNDISDAAGGIGKGTYFDTSLQSISMKKQWVGFHSQPKGKVIIDQGAERALLFGGKSLLPVGIKEISGDFNPGDVVEVINESLQLIGRGVVNYSLWQLQAVVGLSTSEIKKRIDVQRIEVIHRDEWVTLSDQKDQ
jgi:glutamate 5-kinase